MPKRKATNVTISEETINEEDEENGVLTETNLNTQARSQHHLTTQINTPKRKRVSQAFSDLSHLNDVNEVNLERINLIFINNLHFLFHKNQVSNKSIKCTVFWCNRKSLFKKF